MEKPKCNCGNEMNFEDYQCKKCESKDNQEAWNWQIEFHNFNKVSDLEWVNEVRKMKLLFEGYAYCLYAFVTTYHNHEQKIFIANFQDPYIFDEFMNIIETDLTEDN